MSVLESFMVGPSIMESMLVGFGEQWALGDVEGLAVWKVCRQKAVGHWLWKESRRGGFRR